MADLFNGSDYDILNWDRSTRVLLNAEASSPYVSLAGYSTWEVSKVSKPTTWHSRLSFRIEVVV